MIVGQRAAGSIDAQGASDWFARATGFAFSRPDLLVQALTHRSARGANNERLEFLGDAILGFAIAERLFVASPDAREGELTRSRASLVRRETLASIARQMELGEWLVLGSGELKSGGRDRDSILADAFEAALGAVYLDAGIEASMAVIDATFHGRLADVIGRQSDKDYKTRLQEYLQSRAEPLPEYTVIAESGSAHRRQFDVECYLPRLDTRTRGQGNSRRRAEQTAARAMLEQLRQNLQRKAKSYDGLAN